MNPIRLTTLAAIAFLTATTAQATGVLNLYSSRHYQTDEALYKNFEAQTGIKINRIEAAEDPLIERMRSEKEKSPADILITVDMGRLLKAQELGLFQPLNSAILNAKIPRELRAEDGSWFGFSLRARPIFYAKTRVDPKTISDYESLADPKLKGKVCVRSGTHPYNISLMSSLIAAMGPEKAEAWAKGVVSNFARAPKGGDTDQIRAVAAGECDITVGNTYYFARLLRSNMPEDKSVVEKVGVLFPNQGGNNARGAHVNVSGAGIARYAPNRANAVKFLEYLASESAQRFFSDGNNEYPVVGKTDNPALRQMGEFKRDPLSMDMVGKNYGAASQIFDRAGWK